MNYGEINSCYNTGNICVRGSNTPYYYVDFVVYAGGIAGKCELWQIPNTYKYEVGRVVNCYTTGNVSAEIAKSCVGAAVGALQTDTMDPEIYNGAGGWGESANHRIFQVYCLEGTCEQTVGVKGDYANDATSFVTAEELQSDAMLETLGDGYKKDAGAINNGYPVLIWQISEGPAIIDISSAEATIKDQIYTGEALTPEPVVKLGETLLVRDTDYTVEYSSNIEAGTATVTITGIGAYTGTVETTFEIHKYGDDGYCEVCKEFIFKDITGNKSKKYVSWAYENGIVKGTGDNTFSPDDSCSRIQFIMMLWKMHGSPTKGLSKIENPFSDVSGAKTIKAIKWALKEKIINSDTDTFNPDGEISRIQIVMILWKLAGSPEEKGSIPFTDISGKKTTKAVLWAYNKEITKGTGDTTFSPDDPCTRLKLVVFLNKYNNIYKVVS